MARTPDITVTVGATHRQWNNVLQFWGIGLLGPTQYRRGRNSAEIALPPIALKDFALVDWFIDDAELGSAAPVGASASELSLGRCTAFQRAVLDPASTIGRDETLTAQGAQPWLADSPSSPAGYVVHTIPA